MVGKERRVVVRKERMAILFCHDNFENIVLYVVEQNCSIGKEGPRELFFISSETNDDTEIPWARNSRC